MRFSKVNRTHLTLLFILYHLYDFFCKYHGDMAQRFMMYIKLIKGMAMACILSYLAKEKSINTGSKGDIEK